MLKTFHYSYTIVGNLSREVQSLRLRCKCIVSSIINCNDKTVLSRLKSELNSLEKRKGDILNIAKLIQSRTKTENLSVDLLIEICKRPIYQQ